MKKNIFISPHLDDVILSCGELLLKKKKLGEEVLVITIFAGQPEKNEISDFAFEYHKKCKLEIDPVKKRIKEDIKALEFMNVDYQHLNILEALYRREGDYFRYTSKKDIFNSVVEDDIETLSAVLDTLTGTIDLNDVKEFYIPFGFGNHIDHIIVRKAMEYFLMSKKIDYYYYEDIPYIWNVNINEIYESVLKIHLDTEIVTCTNDEWNKKIKAIGFYTSQIGALWENKDIKRFQLDKISKKYNREERSVRLWKKKEEVYLKKGFNKIKNYEMVEVNR